MTDKKNIRTIQAFIPPPSVRQVMCVDMTDEDKEATKKKKGAKEKGASRDGGGMVSVRSAVPDSCTRLTKREILPIVQCLISRTHMTDAQSHFSACSLQWALKFADCTLHPQLYFTVEKNEIRDLKTKL